MYDALREFAKDNYTWSQIQGYGGAIACVEPWNLMLQVKQRNPDMELHFHVDVVTTKTCDDTHGVGTGW